MAPHRRVVNWILHRLADYGFNPWKTVGWSIAVIALSGAIYWSGTTACGSVDCADDSAFVCSQVDGLEARRPGLRPVTEHYPPFQPFIYSLDVFVPILDFGMEEYYRPNTRLPAGRTLYEVMVLERIVGAFLVALAITGFTGLLTRDEP